MIIGFNLIYNFNSSRCKPNFSRGKKLLHVFWNTPYKYNNRMRTHGSKKKKTIIPHDIDKHVFDCIMFDIICNVHYGYVL